MQNVCFSWLTFLLDQYDGNSRWINECNDQQLTVTIDSTHYNKLIRYVSICEGRILDRVKSEDFDQFASSWKAEERCWYSTNVQISKSRFNLRYLERYHKWVLQVTFGQYFYELVFHKPVLPKGGLVFAPNELKIELKTSFQKVPK